MTTARERFGGDCRLTVQYAWRKGVDALGKVNWIDVDNGFRGRADHEGDPGWVAFMTLPTTFGHDGFGYTDAVSLANHEHIADMVRSEEENGETPALVLVSYHNGDEWAVLADAELSEAEGDMIDSLLDYPCLDDDRVGEIESEWEREYWDDMGVWDVAREIADADPDDVRSVIADTLGEVQVWASYCEGMCPIYDREDWARIVDGVREALAKRGATDA